MHKIILAIMGFLLIVPAHAQEIADKIYLGGAIVTIDDAAPTADAVAVRDGRILAVGSVVLQGPLNGGNWDRCFVCGPPAGCAGRGLVGGMGVSSPAGAKAVGLG